MAHTDDHTLYIGTAGGEYVGIPGRDRLEHVFSVGSTGSGKTSTLIPGFIQDAQAGRGAAYFDIHGRTAPLLLDYISRSRQVAYLDASDFNFPFAYNRLHNIAPEHWHLVIDSLMSSFKHVWGDSWGERMDYILCNCLRTLLPLRTATLFDIKRLMTDREWCWKIVGTKIKNKDVQDFWFKEFPWGDDAVSERQRRDWIMPVIDKIGQLAIADPMVNIIGQVRNTIDLRKIIDEQQLLIINLDKTKLGEKNAKLLGSLLISDLNHAAQQRMTSSPFYCYVDEFTQIATSTFADIVSEARNWSLHLHLAGQTLRQIDEHISRATRDAILGNCATLVVFKVAAGDVDVLAPEFTHPFEPTRLRNLERHQAYIRHRNEPETLMRTVPLEGWGFERYGDRDYHIAQSREKYTTPRADVERGRL